MNLSSVVLLINFIFSLKSVIITDYIPEFQRVLDELKKIYGEILYNI